MPRRTKRLLYDSARTAIVVALAVLLLSGENSRPLARCRADLRRQHWAAAQASCAQAEEPEARLGAARAALYRADYAAALAFAKDALPTRYVGDAHMLAGAALFGLADISEDASRGARYAEAAAHLTAAFALHVAARDAHGVVSDTQQLASLRRELGDYQAALALAELSCQAAAASADHGLIVAANVALVDILRELGRFQEAESLLARVDERWLDGFNRGWVLLKRGVLHIEADEWRLARDPLTRAFEEEMRASPPRPDLLESLALNLAWIERKAGALDKSLAYLEHARRAGAGAMFLHLNRGLTLAAANRLEEAASDLAVAEEAGPLGQWLPWVTLQRGLVAHRRGDDALAAACFTRAMDAIDALASGSGAGAPSVIARNREPHLALVGLHAARGDWRAVLDVVARMDASALLASTAAAAELAPSSLDPPQRPAPHAQRVPVAQILAAWRDRRLVVIVPGGERVWRLELRDHVLRDVGDRDELARLALRLESDPLDGEAGRALGDALVPGDTPEGARVELLVIGPLARAPLAALRHGDAAALARWSLVRVAGVLPRAAPARAGAGAVFIADPQPAAGWTLPASRAAADLAAQQLGGAAYTGAQATRARVLEALGHARWLQIATRTGQSADGATLLLHDGALSARELAARQAPEVVVLASCDTAVGSDDAGTGSLASAFLDAGAETVIATRWLIEDAEAARVMAAFYAHDATRDPIAALRAVQQAPGALPVRAWAAFEALVARPTAP